MYVNGIQAWGWRTIWLAVRRGFPDSAEKIRLRLQRVQRRQTETPFMFSAGPMTVDRLDEASWGR
jgi:hypothetical protein